jgi:hypothetical protein
MLTMTHSLDATEARNAEGAVAPRVTLDSMKERIARVDYLRHGLTTICFVTMVNGFKVIGHSTPASPSNFDASKGEANAYENAIRQLWQLEGYLLCERLTNEIFARATEIV